MFSRAGVVDYFWKVVSLIIELDGQVHGDNAQIEKDISEINILKNLDLLS
jgi:very-short-patch-repair endonuclease